MELVLTLHNKITATLQTSIVIIKLLSIIQMTTSLKTCAIIPDLFISIFCSTLIPKIRLQMRNKNWSIYLYLDVTILITGI